MNSTAIHNQLTDRQSRTDIQGGAEKPCGEVLMSAVYGRPKRGVPHPFNVGVGITLLPRVIGRHGESLNHVFFASRYNFTVQCSIKVKMSSSRPLEHLVLLSISTTGSYEEGEEASTVLLAWLIHNVSNNKVTGTLLFYY